MTKTSGEHEPIQLLTKEERDARKAFRQVEASSGMQDYDAAQKAFGDNRERLKSERLAREAATPIAVKPPTRKIKRP